MNMKIQNFNLNNGKQCQLSSAKNKNITFQAKTQLTFVEYLDIPENLGTSYGFDASVYFPKNIQKEIEKIVKSIKGKNNSVTTEIGDVRSYMAGNPLMGDYGFYNTQATRVTSVINGETKSKLFFKENRENLPEVEPKEILNYLIELKNGK